MHKKHPDSRERPALHNSSPLLGRKEEISPTPTGRKVDFNTVALRPFFVGDYMPTTTFKKYDVKHLVKLLDPRGRKTDIYRFSGGKVFKKDDGPPGQHSPTPASEGPEFGSEELSAFSLWTSSSVGMAFSDASTGELHLTLIDIGSINVYSPEMSLVEGGRYRLRVDLYLTEESTSGRLEIFVNGVVVQTVLTDIGGVFTADFIATGSDEIRFRLRGANAEGWVRTASVKKYVEEE